jgi:hypothetical protein
MRLLLLGRKRRLEALVTMRGSRSAVDARIDALVVVVLALGLNGALQRILGDDEGLMSAVDAMC